MDQHCSHEALQATLYGNPSKNASCPMETLYESILDVSISKIAIFDVSSPRGAI